MYWLLCTVNCIGVKDTRGRGERKGDKIEKQKHNDGGSKYRGETTSEWRERAEREGERADRVRAEREEKGFRQQQCLIGAMYQRVTWERTKRGGGKAQTLDNLRRNREGRVSSRRDRLKVKLENEHGSCVVARDWRGQTWSVGVILENRKRLKGLRWIVNKLHFHLWLTGGTCIIISLRVYVKCSVWCSDAHQRFVTNES